MYILETFFEVLDISFVLQINSQSICPSDKTKSHGIYLLPWQEVLPENYNYLNQTNLLEWCYSVVQFSLLDCEFVVITQ